MKIELSDKELKFILGCIECCPTESFYFFEGKYYDNSKFGESLHKNLHQKLLEAIKNISDIS